MKLFIFMAIKIFFGYKNFVVHQKEKKQLSLLAIEFEDVKFVFTCGLVVCKFSLTLIIFFSWTIKSMDTSAPGNVIISL